MKMCMYEIKKILKKFKTTVSWKQIYNLQFNFSLSNLIWNLIWVLHYSW